MPLPILKHASPPTPADLLRLCQQTGRAWAGQLADPHQLDAATAYANPALPRVADANQARDAALPPGTPPANAAAEIDAHFAAAGARCGKWALNVALPTNQTAPLAAHLESVGFSRIERDVMHRATVTRLADEPALPGVKILPARAAFRHARALYAAAAARDAGADAAAVDERAEAEMLRLDDSHYDALIALHDGEPVGAVGVLAVGDLGRVEGLLVVPAFRRRGLGRALLGRAMETCARSLFKHVFAEVGADERDAARLLSLVGFAVIGQSHEWVSPDFAGK